MAREKRGRPRHSKGSTWRPAKDGVRLRRWREGGNYPLKKLAEYAGVSVSTVSRWERGMNAPPPDVVNRLLTVMEG